MNPKALLYAHGEKLLVALVLLVAGWYVYATATDPETRAEVTPLELENFKGRLTNAYDRQVSPNFTPPHRFLDALQSRLRIDPDGQPVLAFLSDHPDLGPAGPLPVNTRFHIYEIPRPTVTASDNIGILNVSVQLPQPGRPNDSEDLVKAGPGAVEWRREEPQGTVINRATIAAVQLEYHLGDEDWQPLATAEHPDGLIPFDGRSVPTQLISDVETLVTYHIRARLVAAVTGTVDPEELEPGREIVPVDQPLELRRVPRTADGIADLAAAFTAGALDHLAEPFPGDLPGDAPGRGFVGQPSEVVDVQTRSSVFIGLTQVRGGLGGQGDRAVLTLKRLVLSPAGEHLGWTPPHQVTLEPGDPVEGEVTFDPPWDPHENFPVPFELPTPFVISPGEEGQPPGIERRIKRVAYWKVMLTDDRNAQGQRIKRFAVEPHEITTNLVHLLNERTGATVRLLELATIPEPYRYWVANFVGDVPPTYPIVPPGGINEAEIFESAPLRYRMPPLVPEQPEIRTDPALLQELFGAAALQILNQDYVVTPDDRVYVYHTGQRKVIMKAIPGGHFATHGMPATGQMGPEREPEEDERRDDRDPGDDDGFSDRPPSEDDQFDQRERERQREIDPDNPYGR